MSNFDNVPLLWRTQAVLFMIAALDSKADPDAYIEDWFDEAAAGDDDYVEWAMKSWQEVRNWNWMEREQQRRIMLNLLAELRKQL